VEEWMASPWSSARDWSEPTQRSSLQIWHERLDTKSGGRPKGLGDQAFRQICGPDHDLIQIAFPAEYPPRGPKTGNIFFLVRELGPHLYRLLNITKKSASDCSDPEADDSQGEHLLPESMNRRR